MCNSCLAQALALSGGVSPCPCKVTIPFFKFLWCKKRKRGRGILDDGAPLEILRAFPLPNPPPFSPPTSRLLRQSPRTLSRVPLPLLPPSSRSSHPLPNPSPVNFGNVTRSSKAHLRCAGLVLVFLSTLVGTVGSLEKPCSPFASVQRESLSRSPESRFVIGPSATAHLNG